MTTTGLLVLSLLALAQPPAPAQPSVFGIAQRQERYTRLQREISESFKKKQYTQAEKKCAEAIALLPMAPLAYYDLACARARLGNKDEAFAALKDAVERGFGNVKHMKEDADLETLRKDPRFEQLATKAEKARMPELWPEKVDSGIVKDGEVRVGERNTAWDFRNQILRVTVNPGPPPKDVPIVKGRGKTGDLLREWSKDGTAAGNHGDFYDNHDGDHSNMHYGDFPQLTRIEFDKEVSGARLHSGLQAHFFYNVVTLGNSSTAMTTGPFWRSQTRLAYANPRLVALLYNQYTNNHLYLYPEHRDHDPGHNGTGDGHGDVYPANTPYLITSQGSSGSDIVFLDALAETLAAFRPDVKRFLVQEHVLMPTIQMIFRRSNKNVKKDDDYLTGKAHPTVFEGRNVDQEAMVRLAHEMTRDSVPPLVQLRVVEEDKPFNGRDFFGPDGQDERLFDTPAAIARVHRSTQKSRRIVVSAEGSSAFDKKTLTYHWVVLRGDPKTVTIKPLNTDGSQAEIRVPYFERGPIEPRSKLESCRVDIGVFVHNGKYPSAPAFVTICTLDSEKRVYNAKGLIESVDYTTGNYVDPLVEARKDWRDEYHYDKADRLTGWTRRRGKDEQAFTADGALVQTKDDKGRPLTARMVIYTAKAGKDGAPVLEQTLGGELLQFDYATDEDRVGRVKSREKVMP